MSAQQRSTARRAHDRIGLWSAVQVLGRTELAALEAAQLRVSFSFQTLADVC